MSWISSDTDFLFPSDDAHSPPETLPERKNLPSMAQVILLSEVVSLKRDLFPDGKDQPACVLGFEIRERIFRLLEAQTENDRPEQLRRLAHGISRSDTWQLFYPGSLINYSWRVSILLTQWLGITVSDISPPETALPPTRPRLLDVHSTKSEWQWPILYQSHYFQLDALLRRLLKIGEDGERCDRPDADTFVLRVDDSPYGDLIETHLNLNLVDRFYNAPSVAYLKSEASHAMRSPHQKKKNAWDKSLCDLEAFCQRKVDKKQTSVIYVPVDTFYSYGCINFSSKIPERYTAAIERARKNGHMILLVTRKPVSAHRNFFHATGVFFQRLFGNDSLGETDPNVVHFSPTPAENNRVHHLHILHLLYQSLAKDIKGDIDLARSDIAGLSLFEQAFESPETSSEREWEVLRKVHFLKELALILSLRDKWPHTIPHVGHTLSELEQLIKLIQYHNFQWNSSIWWFVQETMQNPYTPKILRQRLWEQFCLFCHQWADDEISNALERSSERLSDTISDGDSLRLAFEYYLAKMIYIENWSMPWCTWLTRWTPEMYNDFVQQHSQADFLEASLAEEIFPHPGPYRDPATWTMILHPKGLTSRWDE